MKTTKNKSSEKSKCITNIIFKWLGFTSHKWVYKGNIHRKCSKCGETQVLIDYDAFYTIWKIKI